MEKLVKQERKNHDAHDIFLGTLYYFPERAEWDELKFHDALHKLSYKYRVLDKLEFKNVDKNYYCDEIGKVFDLLELSGLLKRDGEFTKLNMDIIKLHFDDELRSTFDETDLNSLKDLSEDLQKELKIF